MEDEGIGLKLADGKLYVVLQDGEAARKRLVVTTVEDDQPSVQIDLYRGSGPSVADAEYIGSLVVEGIPPLPKGEPDIGLELGLAEDETLTVIAEEASTGTSRSLQVSLKALAEEEKYDIPDFDFSSEGGEPVGNESTEMPEPSFSDEDFEGTDSLPSLEEEEGEAFEEASSEEASFDDKPFEDEAFESGERGLLEPIEESPMGRQGGRALRAVLVAACVLAIALGLAYFIYALVVSGKGAAFFFPERSATSAQVTTEVPPSAPPPAAVSQPQPAVASAPSLASEETKPSAPPKPVPGASTAKSAGTWYRIKWGDTLWDLSYAYYRNPWLYPSIAQANKIRNPDRIITGTRIWIPAR